MSGIHIVNKQTRSILSIFFALIFFVTSGFSQAMLLNPNGEGTGHWESNGYWNCEYLKPRFSYLSSSNGGKNSAYMLSFKRISVAEGSLITNNPANYYRRTCLSISYDKDWVEWKNGDVVKDSIDNNYPDIIYAYSVYNKTEGGKNYYDVYWYSDDEHPIFQENSDCYNLFQNNNSGTGSYIIDVSGIEDWDFSNVISLMQMFKECKRLKTIKFNNANFTNVTTIQDMFSNCNALTANDIVSIFSELNFDIIKIQGAVHNNYRFSNLDYNISEIITKNKIKYQVSYKNNNGQGTSKGSYLTAGVLPIELSLFTATQQGENILFVWETATETNNDYFTIEQSLDGVSFHEIARITGAGTTSSYTLYEYSYPISIEGIVYFRLKQTDYNGDYSYSNIKTIDVVGNSPLRMYPIPALAYITIEGDYESVQFVDVNGVIHTPQRAEGNTYPLTSFPKGMFFAIVTLKNGEIVTRQFLHK